MMETQKEEMRLLEKESKEDIDAGYKVPEKEIQAEKKLEKNFIKKLIPQNDELWKESEERDKKNLLPDDPDSTLILSILMIFSLL